ncbi:MAG: SDR family oxidoreductase [Streptosporangiales bacterium]|nr:SDR family oxidoreductase [Streptosporangiales bacterium]
MASMIDLTHRVALVAGGAGAVGEGIVRAFLQRGATVVVPSRSAERLIDLRRRLDDPENLLTLEGDVSTVEGAAEIRDRALDEAGDLDAVVASVGGWWQGGDLVDVDTATWRRVLDDNLTTHFVLARTFVPVLRERASTYLMITGDAADVPVAGASLVSVAAAGLLALFRSLVLELRGSPIRVNVLYLGPVITRNRPDGRPDWLTADEVGTHAAYLASDEGAMAAGSVIRLTDRPPGRAAR